jgi:NADH-quinone oxidoreductase subunit B
MADDAEGKRQELRSMSQEERIARARELAAQMRAQKRAEAAAAPPSAPAPAAERAASAAATAVQEVPAQSLVVTPIEETRVIRDDPEEALPEFVPEDLYTEVKTLRPVEPPEAKSLYRSLLPGVIQAPADWLFAWGRKSSLWPLTFGLACCAIEMISTYMSRHDLDRFGIIPWPSPRQADVMIVAGTVTKKMAPAVKLLYEQMPNPKWVISMGACATNGGPYTRYDRVLQGVDKIVPVDVYVPGCPPRPEALMDAFIALQNKIMEERGKIGR